MSYSNEKDTSPLAALEPLHALVQLIPATSSGMSTGTGRGDEHQHKYVLLTSLRLDAWVVHVGHSTGRWWKGAWRAADVERLAVRDLPPPPLPLPPASNHY
jgi:hypothetical protein